MQGVGVTLDLEGTTVDLESQRHGAHLDAAASFGLAIDRQFAVSSLPHFIGGPDEKVAEDIYALAHAELRMPRPEFVTEFLARDTELFEKRLETADIRPRDGVSEVLSWVNELRVPLALGSLTREDQGRRILNSSGLSRFFGPRVVFREHVREPKPAPEVYLATAQLMDVPSSGQIVFDDSPRGIRAAYAAHSSPIGMPVILEKSALGALEAERPLRIFRDWRDPELREYVRELLLKLQRGDKDAVRIQVGAE
jgi:beta-phosphoglucomutase-like phosphatase (HAD superfamily)